MGVVYEGNRRINRRLPDELNAGQKAYEMPSVWAGNPSDAPLSTLTWAYLILRRMTGGNCRLGRERGVSGVTTGIDDLHDAPDPREGSQRIG